MFSQFVPLCLSCRFLVGGVNQRSWERLANLPGAFKSWLSQSLSPHISPKLSLVWLASFFHLFHSTQHALHSLVHLLTH